MPTLTIIGATGAVGAEALSILESRGFPAHRLRLAASTRSAGSSIPYSGARLPVHAADDLAFAAGDVVILAADAATARAIVPCITAAGATAIDNSSAFRLDPDVPLIIPEINAHLLDEAPPLIANPNCSTIILLVALNPLRRAHGVVAVTVSTYQAVSGAGLSAINELHTQTRDILAARPVTASVFHEPCAFNIFSHDSAVSPHDGLNGEERKIIDETRKIWDDPALPISPTCIRVPIVRAHGQSVSITLSEPAAECAIRAALAAAESVRIIDDRAANSFPTPLKATSADDILVGRIRPDPAHPLDARGRSRHWCLFIAGDQLRKGAALNALQIAGRLTSPASATIASIFTAETQRTREIRK